MTDLQKCSFELLRIFVGICEKWDIPYFLVCGSALGAVKYGGFIPWDDDVDVGLLRRDYDRFLEVAAQELPQWCFLQNYKTEKNATYTYSKLRNSNTTFIEQNVASMEMNHGVYLDIFPLDGYPQGRLEAEVFELKRRLNGWVRYSVCGDSQNPKVRRRNKILRRLGVQNRAYQSHVYIDKLYASYPPEQSKLWCNFGNWQGKLEYAPKWHYGQGTYATFEGLRVRIPENYDAYLTQKYGDWRNDPPPDAQKTHHLSTIIDTERPYTFYLNREKE